MSITEHSRIRALFKIGYELNCPVKTAPGGSGHKSMFELEPADDSPSKFVYNNILIESVKYAEDKSGDIIVRLYESQNTAAACTLRSDFPLQSAFSTDMIESVQNELDVHNNGIKLYFRPFEIKTIRLAVNVKEVS